MPIHSRYISKHFSFLHYVQGIHARLRSYFVAVASLRWYRSHAGYRSNVACMVYPEKQGPNYVIGSFIVIAMFFQVTYGMLVILLSNA